MTYNESQYDRPWRGLPPEIRSQIYTYALTVSSGIKITERLALPINASRSCLYTRQAPCLLPLLLTSRNEHLAILTAFYSSPFHLDAPPALLTDFLTTLAASHRLRMTNVHLSPNVLSVESSSPYPAETAELLNTILTNMNVRVLNLHTHEGVNDVFAIKAAARGLFRQQIAELRVVYDTGPFAHARVPEDLNAGTVIRSILAQEVDATSPSKVDREPLWSTGLFDGMTRKVEDEGEGDEDWRLWEITMGTVNAGEEKLVIVVKSRDVKGVEDGIASMQRKVAHGGEMWDGTLAWNGLEARIRKGRKAVTDFKAQRAWAEDQKQRLCEGVCSVGEMRRQACVEVVKENMRAFWAKSMVNFP